MLDQSPLVEGSGVSIYRDRSFWGLTVGQFLGAFNDNLFKQLVLLLCVDHALAETPNEPNKYQPIALAIFALPWVLFSGLAGFVSDRTSKQRGIVLYKSLEIAVTLAGMAAFLSNRLVPVFVVLFLLSLHSTFFGPCKYGILPELFRKRDLPQINGVFQMSTFLAIIFGTALAGYAKQMLPGQSGLAQISLWCVMIAAAGTAAVLFVRHTRAAQPGLPWSLTALGISADTWAMLRADRFLLGVLLLTSLFWFMGGVVQPAVNVLGKVELHLGDGRTSLLVACLGIGIALGCAVAGRVSQKHIRFGVVNAGAWGMVVGLTAVAVLAFFTPARLPAAVAQESLVQLLRPTSMAELLARLALVELGIAAGLFVVPLQVVLQVSPPDELKGRMIGTMNLVNWIGILLAAVFAGLFDLARVAINTVFVESPTSGVGMLPPSTIFGALAVLTAPVAMFYRPADRALD